MKTGFSNLKIFALCAGIGSFGLAANYLAEMVEKNKPRVVHDVSKFDEFYGAYNSYGKAKVGMDSSKIDTDSLRMELDLMKLYDEGKKYNDEANALIEIMHLE